MCHSFSFLYLKPHTLVRCPVSLSVAYKNGLRSKVSPPTRANTLSIPSTNVADMTSTAAAASSTSSLMRRLCAWPFNRSTSALPPAWILCMRIRSILCISRRSSKTSRNTGYASSMIAFACTSDLADACEKQLRTTFSRRTSPSTSMGSNEATCRSTPNSCARCSTPSTRPIRTASLSESRSRRLHSRHP